jgi:23S rRNA (uracil1939-C5)-methyltransferase
MAKKDTNSRSKNNNQNQYKKQNEKKDLNKSNKSSYKPLNKVSNRSKKDMVCKYSKKCGACEYIEKSNTEQLKIKQKEIRILLDSFGKVKPIIGMDQPYNYRNKVHATFDRRYGEIVSGMYQAKTHQVVNIDACKIDNELADEIILTIRKLIPSFKIKTYDEDTGYGLLRHVLVRRGHKSGEVLVVLVTGYPTFPSKKNFAKELVRRHPEITSIVQNINDKNTSMVLGDRENVLYGKGYIVDELCGKTFKISPKSFYQINSVQTEKLYNKAIEYADLKGNETVIDAYCGIGTIGMVASEHANKVIGIELNRDAVRDAITNCKHNKINNFKIYQGDAGAFMDSISEEDEKIDVVFMDPPRSGSTKQFLDSVVRLAPKKVVYVSCSPETLARDLKYITKKGYKVVEMQPVDMFPFTKHCECVVKLKKA